MSFISAAAHRKFVSQCEGLIKRISDESLLPGSSEKAERLKADLAELQLLLDAYLAILAQVPALTRDYNLLQRRIRVQARKMQPAKTAEVRRK